jgi:hypothetical protein
MSNVWSDEERMNAIDGIERGEKMPIIRPGPNNMDELMNYILNDEPKESFWRHNLPLFTFWAILGVIVLVALWMGMFV